MELQKTKNDEITLKINNILIHSKYNPTAEAERFVKGLDIKEGNNNYVVYGLGLGYHILQLLRNIDKDSKIIVFEYNTEIINICKEISKEIFEHENIIIISGDNIDFYNLLSNELEKVNDIIIHKNSLEALVGINDNLYHILKNYYEVREAIKKDSKLLNKNLASNDLVQAKEIREFILNNNLEDKQVIIVASGPSLDNEIEKLKNNKEKFFIFAVGSALRILMENDIKPNAIVIIDGKKGVKNQIEGYENQDIPLLFLATASRWAVSSYNGPKYVYYNNIEEEYYIETGKTVAIAAMSIAVRCKAKEIIFLGQDLAFIDNKTHNSSFNELYSFTNNEVNNNMKIRQVKSVTGGLVNTKSGYLIFKDGIEKIIRNNKKINFINCGRGAYIDGAENISFKEYLER